MNDTHDSDSSPNAETQTDRREGINFNAASNVEIGNDLIGRDKITTEINTSGHIIQAGPGSTVNIGINRQPISLIEEESHRSDSPPFKGLLHYDEADADLYFGRTALVNQIISLLHLGPAPANIQNRFVAIVGASGCGKSSLVRAGLIPSLKNGGLPYSNKWQYRVVTPTRHPIEALAIGLANEVKLEWTVQNLINQLSNDPSGLHLISQQISGNNKENSQLLLVVDQLEELFTLCNDEDEREKFIANILYASQVENSCTIIILTLRADFYPKCALYAGLRQQITRPQILVGPMSEIELREAIVSPIKRRGLEYEDGLVETILEDVAGQPGALPLLQHALLETWVRRKGNSLSLSSYQASGRVKGAIAQRADKVYNDFPDFAQDIFRKILLRLVRPGDGTEDTRRRADLAEFSFRDVNAEIVNDVLKALADARLITIDATSVEVAHEALIGGWPRLQHWLNEDRASANLHYQLAEAAKNWDRLSRTEGELYHSTRLAQVIEWSRLHNNSLTLLEQEFIEASIERERIYSERVSELSKRNDLMRALNTLSVSLTQTLETNALLRETAEQLAEIFAVDHVSMIMVDDQAQLATVEEEHPAMGALGLQLTLSTDAVGHQVLARRVVVISDVATDRQLSEDFRAKLSLVGIKSLLLAPFVSQGRSFGAFTLDSLTPRTFTTVEIEVSQDIAEQISFSLINAQFARNLEDRVIERTKEVQKERERVETLLQITTELSSSLELDRVLYRSLQLVTDAVGAMQGSIFTIDDNDQLIYRAALGSPKVLTSGSERMPFKKHEGLVGWVIKNRQPAVIGNLDRDTRWKKIPGQNVNHKSALAVPLIAHEEVLGAMLLFSPMYNAFDDDAVRLASAAANQVGTASNNAELYSLIRDQAERLGLLLRQQEVETIMNRAILESLVDGVLVANTEGQIIVFNSASERTLSMSRESVLGRKLIEFIGLYGLTEPKWVETIQKWVKGVDVSVENKGLEQKLELEDKSMLSISMKPILHREEYLGVVVFFRILN